jgi:choline-sulfatase
MGLAGKLTRREFLWATGAIEACALQSVTRDYGDVPNRPNIIVFLTDQQRSDTLGCYGNKLVKTPNLDQLAASGTRFTNAYCTTPLCSPARASILTGVHPHRHGVVDLWGKIPSFRGPVPGWPYPTSKELPWTGEVFDRAGYETAYVGKWHCLTGSDRRGFREVLARYGDFDIDTPEQNEYTADVLKKGYRLRDLRGHGEDYIAEGFGYGTSIFKAADHVSTFIFDHACEFVRRPHTRPFCLFVSTLSPHNPYAPPEPYNHVYKPEDVTLPPNVDVHARQRRPISLRSHPEERAWSETASKDELRKAWAHYLGSVTHLDDLMGGFLRELEKANLKENTLILFTSDHGDSMGSHRVENKAAFMYDTVVRVPLIVSFPKSIKAQALTTPVSQVGILPTLLNFAGIRDTVVRDGVSWVPALCGNANLPLTPVFCEYNRFYGEHFPVRAIITPQYKYVHYFGPEGELFDRTEDPYEMFNLIYSPAHFEPLANLRRQLFGYMARSKDPYFSLLSSAEKQLVDTGHVQAARRNMR